jgi:hypothetical protein
LRIEVVYRGVVIGTIHDAGSRHTLTTPCVIERNDALNINVYDGPAATPSNYNVLTQIAAGLDRQASATERMANFQGNIERAINEEFTFLHEQCRVQQAIIDKLNVELAASRGGDESEPAA